jgi:hypothetical protein
MKTDGASDQERGAREKLRRSEERCDFLVRSAEDLACATLAPSLRASGCDVMVTLDRHSSLAAFP